jgi:acetoin utilization deacetylase AcuC-like enzyme
MHFAYISHPDCMRHEMGLYHPECPDRVRVIHQRLLAAGLLDDAICHEAPAATVEQLSRAHSRAHVLRLEALAPADGYAALDPDTSMNPYTWHAALAAAGAGVLATDLVGAGRARRVFCNVRPPGHHAMRSTAMGFCFFNNVAVAIHHALDTLGFDRVALVDFDVHHGNGSEDIVAGDERILMLSTFQSPLYPYSGEVPSADNLVSVPLAPHTSGAALRAAVLERWLDRLQSFEPQLIFISAGFDAHEEDDISHLRWQDEDYAWVTRELVKVSNRHAEGRIISMLEGGYALAALARSAELHVRELKRV